MLTTKGLVIVISVLIKMFPHVVQPNVSTVAHTLLTLLHSEQPKLYGALAVFSAKGLRVFQFLRIFVCLVYSQFERAARTKGS